MFLVTEINNNKTLQTRLQQVVNNIFLVTLLDYYNRLLLLVFRICERNILILRYD